MVMDQHAAQQKACEMTTPTREQVVQWAIKAGINVGLNDASPYPTVDHLKKVITLACADLEANIAEQASILNHAAQMEAMDRKLIAEQAAELESLRGDAERYKLEQMSMVKKERDTLRRLIEERDAEIERLKGEAVVSGVELHSLKFKLNEANKERAWVRRKLEIPEDTGFLSGEVTLAGTMHCVCHEAHGYRTYIETEKCDDKGGQIARLSKQLAENRAEMEKLRAAATTVLLNDLDKSEVHPCDIRNLEVQAKMSSPDLSTLYHVLTSIKDLNYEP